MALLSLHSVHDVWEGVVCAAVQWHKERKLRVAYELLNRNARLFQLRIGVIDNWREAYAIRRRFVGRVQKGKMLEVLIARLRFELMILNELVVFEKLGLAEEVDDYQRFHGKAKN